MSDQSEPVTPVLFRVHRRPKTHGDDVTAVFPAEPAGRCAMDNSLAPLWRPPGWPRRSGGTSLALAGSGGTR